MRNIVLGPVSVGPNRMSNKQGSHVEMNVDCCILLVPRETAQNIYMRNIVLGPVSVGPNRMSNKQGSHIEINVDCILVPKESTQKSTQIFYYDMGHNRISKKQGSHIENQH